MGTRIVTARSRAGPDRVVAWQSGITSGLALIIAIAAGFAAAVTAGADPGKPDQKMLAQGREFFVRQWQPGDDGTLDNRKPPSPTKRLSLDRSKKPIVQPAAAGS